jgi:hypothetical protein
MLTPHFTWAEVIRSPTARRLRIDNNLKTQQLVDNARFTAGQMEAVRNLLGEPIRVNSWYRSPELNAAVGGSKTSAHMKALAVDGEPVQMPLTTAFEIVAASTIPFDQLIHERTRDGADWIHFGFTRGQPRRQILRASGAQLGGPMNFERVLVG